MYIYVGVQNTYIYIYVCVWQSRGQPKERQKGIKRRRNNKPATHGSKQGRAGTLAWLASQGEDRIDCVTSEYTSSLAAARTLLRPIIIVVIKCTKLQLELLDYIIDLKTTAT